MKPRMLGSVFARRSYEYYTAELKAIALIALEQLFSCNARGCDLVVGYRRIDAM